MLIEEEVLLFITAYQTSGRTEPRQEQDRSHRASLLPRTAHKRSWPPENKTQKVTFAVRVSVCVCACVFAGMHQVVTFMSVSRGM